MKNSFANTRGRSPTLRQYMKESVQIKKRKNSVAQPKKQEDMNTIFKNKVMQLINLISIKVKQKTAKTNLKDKVQELLQMFNDHFDCYKVPYVQPPSHEINYQKFQSQDKTQQNKVDEMPHLQKQLQKNHTMTESITLPTQIKKQKNQKAPQKQQKQLKQPQKQIQPVNMNPFALLMGSKPTTSPQPRKEKSDRNKISKEKKQNRKKKPHDQDKTQQDKVDVMPYLQKLLQKNHIMTETITLPTQIKKQKNQKTPQKQQKQLKQPQKQIQPVNMNPFALLMGPKPTTSPQPRKEKSDRNKISKEKKQNIKKKPHG